VKPTIQPARSDTRLLVAPDRGQPTNAAFPGAFQDECNCGMDEAIAFEEVSRSTVLRLNSYALEISENASWLTPVVGGLFYMVAKSIAFCIELQMNWLTLFTPHALSHPSSVPDSQAQPTAEELAYSMDIAIGEPSAAPSGMVVSHAQPTAMVVPEQWRSRAA
jgi:hypothetical protein